MNIEKATQSAKKYYQAGNLQQAKEICKKILQKRQNNIDALCLLGVIYYQIGNYDYSIKYFQKALQINPNLPEANSNLGFILQERGQLDNAMTYTKKALQINSNFPEAHNHMGLILQKDRQFDEAIKSYQKAIELNPYFDKAYNNLGTALNAKGLINEAIVNYQKALHLNPINASTCNNLGMTFKDAGQINEAEIWIKRALQIEPHNSIYYSNLLWIMNCNGHYDATSVYIEHLNFSKQYEERFSSSILPHTNNHDSSRKLKIGYVSPDFRRHSVSYFLEPVLASHKHDQFEVFCYSDVMKLQPDKVTERLKGYADNWREISGLSDEQASELCRKDRIDILVDLAGHTAYNRLQVFARKPAPIQVSWLGYPNTTGLSAIDYRIVDGYTDPPGLTDPFCSEKLIRMPESFICYLPDKNSPTVGDLPALNYGYVTFASFNVFPKVSQQTTELWAEILKAVPDSRLIMKTRSFLDETTCKYAREMFKSHGVSPDRIELMAYMPSFMEHLALYNRIDISLDTFPYHGTTTTCEAIWMGVPVITLAGKTHASRVGFSFLSNIGLKELITKAPDEYIETAVNLAKDLKRLQSLRLSLRDMMKHSPLCNANKFTENLEIVYHRMWEKYCNSV